MGWVCRRSLSSTSAKSRTAKVHATSVGGAKEELRIRLRIGGQRLHHRRRRHRTVVLRVDGVALEDHATVQAEELLPGVEGAHVQVQVHLRVQPTGADWTGRGAGQVGEGVCREAARAIVLRRASLKSISVGVHHHLLGANLSLSTGLALLRQNDRSTAVEGVVVVVLVGVKVEVTEVLMRISAAV